jgi:hypothetical protein
MASVKTSAKPAPKAPTAKPVGPAPKAPAPKAAAAPKPAGPAPKGPAPKTNGAAPKASAAAAPKPNPTPTPKPTPKAPAAEAGVTRAEFEKLRGEWAAFAETVTQTQEALATRLDGLELALNGLGPFASTDDEGNLVLDLDNADEETLRNWSWMFSVSDHTAEDSETIRAAFKKTRSAKSFKGWEQKQALPRPEAEAAAEGEEAATEEEVEVEITPEYLDTLNWADLKPFADQLGIDYSGIKPQNPKVLRAAILTAAAAVQGEEGEGEGSPIEEGTTVHVLVGDETYEGTFQGQDEEGNGVVAFDEENVQAYPMDSISVAG